MFQPLLLESMGAGTGLRLTPTEMWSSLIAWRSIHIATVSNLLSPGGSLSPEVWIWNISLLGCFIGISNPTRLLVGHPQSAPPTKHWGSALIPLPTPKPRILIGIFKFYAITAGPSWEFPAGPVIRTVHPLSGSLGSTPAWGSKIPQVWRFSLPHKKGAVPSESADFSQSIIMTPRGFAWIPTTVF